MGPDSSRTDFSVDKLSQALFIINRNAKTAPDSKYLYLLKQAAIQKMLQEGKAQKIGLHYSRNPKFCQQQLDVLIACGKYYFHIPPTKEDIRNLKNLGKLDEHVRNPKTIFPLKEAKRILEKYTGLTLDKEKTKQRFRPAYRKPVFKRLGE